MIEFVYLPMKIADTSRKIAAISGNREMLQWIDYPIVSFIRSRVRVRVHVSSSPGFHAASVLSQRWGSPDAACSSEKRLTTDRVRLFVRILIPAKCFLKPGIYFHNTNFSLSEFIRNFDI